MEELPNGKAVGCYPTDPIKRVVQVQVLFLPHKDKMKRSKPQRRKEKLLRKKLKDKKVWETLGAALAAPIRRQLDYEGIFRKAVTITPLPTGAPLIYDADIELTDEEKEELRIANKPW